MIAVNAVKSLIMICDYCHLSYRKTRTYRRKCRVNKVLNNTIDNYHIMLSYDELNKFYCLFQIAEQFHYFGTLFLNLALPRAKKDLLIWPQEGAMLQITDY